MVVLGVQLLLEAIREQNNPDLKRRASHVLDLLKDEFGEYKQVLKN